MLPKVAIGRPNPSVQTNIESYRLLVGDEMIDELLALTRDLGKVRASATSTQLHTVAGSPSCSRATCHYCRVWGSLPSGA